MKSTFPGFAGLCATLVAVTVFAADTDGWESMFNADNLDGWVNVNGSPETWSIKDGVISCTGHPVAALRTVKRYENFELELEWRHLKPSGNAGIFVWASALPAVGQPFLRAIEVQVLENAYGGKDQNIRFTTHGDIFPIHGATMTPMRPQTHKGDKSRCFPIEERSKPSPEWNHYRIVAHNGSIRLSVNGKEVSGGDQCTWRKGYLGLESEGSPTEWRNVRLKELPSTGATAEQSAPVDEGWRPLFTGIDLRGWKQEGGGAVAAPGKPPAWTTGDWTLNGSREQSLPSLWTEESFGDAEFMIDSKLPAEAGKSAFAPGLAFRSPKAPPIAIAGPTDAWHRRVLKVSQGTVKMYDESGRLLSESSLPADAPARGPLGLISKGGYETQFANIFVREMK
jgi:hypothetical protein